MSSAAAADADAAGERKAKKEKKERGREAARAAANGPGPHLRPTGQAPSNSPTDFFVRLLFLRLFLFLFARKLLPPVSKQVVFFLSWSETSNFLNRRL